MRGGKFVVGFAALGMLVAVAALWLNGNDAWCRDAKRLCGQPLLVDPAWVVAITALGIIGLLAIMLICNGLGAWLKSRGRQT